MIKLSSEILIGETLFNFVNEVEITSTWEELTDIATIKVPKKLKIARDGMATDYITGPQGTWRRGDRVRINLGYDEVLDLRFDGYLTRVAPKLPLEFHCEDLMWHLKQVTVKAYSEPKEVSLKAVLTAILPKKINDNELKFEALEMSFDKFKIEKCTVAQVLDYLKRSFGLSAFFKDGILYVGFAYPTSRLSEITQENLAEFEFQRNIIDDSKLDFIYKDDITYNVTAINIKKDNKRTEVKVGDQDGDSRTFYFYNIKDSDLERLANESLEKVKYTGFRGSFTTFLQPMVKHGQAIKLVDPLVKDRNGVYLVRKVTTTFGQGGGRQEITLDKQIE